MVATAHAARACLTFLLALTLCALCWGQRPTNKANVLVLIDSDAIERNVSPEFYHAQWIQWAPSSGADGSNRLLSLLTGMDWRGEPSDFSFRRSPEGQWISLNHDSLVRRGVFRAERGQIDSLEPFGVALPELTAPRSILGLAIREGSNAVRLHTPYEPFPDSKLVVFQARSWNDLPPVTAQTRGRILVVEFPPNPTTRLSRAWFYGPWMAGVPTLPGVGVPGLIPARSAARLLLEPEAAAWSADDPGPMGDARHWVEHAWYTGPVIFAILAFIGAYVVGCALYYILKEERAPVASWLLRVFYLSPAILVVSGELTHVFGMGMWVVAMMTGVGFVLLLWGLVSLVARRLSVPPHPFWADSLTGLIVLAAVRPLWSFFSPVMFGSTAVSGEAVGAFLLYMAGAVCLRSGDRWPGRIICGLLFLFGLTGYAWWASGQPGMALVSVVAVLAGEGLLKLAIVPLAIVSDPTFRWLRSGLTYAPGGLYRTYESRGALNVGQHLAFVTSAPVLLFGLCVVMLVLAGDKFLMHKMRRALAIDPRPRALRPVALACTAMGIFEPIYLTAGLMVAIGLLVIGIFDAAQPS